MSTTTPESIAEILPENIQPDDYESIDALDRGRGWLLEPHPERVRGIFDDITDRFIRFRVAIQFEDKVCGGIPNDPKIVQSWIASKTGIKDEERLRAMAAKFIAMDGGIDPNASVDLGVLDKAVEDVANVTNLCVFRRDENGIYLENRHIKACLRESTNILYAGTRFGPTKKSPKSFVAERLFVEEMRIYLKERDDSNNLRTKRRADGTLTFTGHVSGPTGERAVLTRYEYAIQPEAHFHIRVATDPKNNQLYDDLDERRILETLAHCERIGLGALRSQSMGMFKVIDWARVEKRHKMRVSDVAKVYSTNVVVEE